MRTGRPAILPDPSHELQHDAWFAGFVAGEGSFLLNRDARGYGTYYVPRLKIALRDDDADVLYEVQEAFGGAVEVHRMTASRRTHPNARDQLRWVLGGKVALMGLVAYLDRFPLRNKKAAEYVIWRGAVLAYVEDGGKSPILREAKTRLESVRTYVAKPDMALA